MADHREEMHALLAKLRGMGPEVSEPLFRLLELIVLRFDSPFTAEEAPTLRRPTPAPMSAVKGLAGRVDAILSGDAMPESKRP